MIPDYCSFLLDNIDVSPNADDIIMNAWIGNDDDDDDDDYLYCLK